MRHIQYLVLMALWGLLLMITPAKSQDCPYGWFGTNCQFKCHCSSGTCDPSTGHCDSRMCASGWFGENCQYADMVFRYSLDSTPRVLLDKNDSTCLSDRNLQSLTVNLTQAFPFTWLRMKIEHADLTLLRSLHVELHGPSNSGKVTCNDMRTTAYSKRVLDVYCDGDVEVQSVIIAGDGVKNLCTVLLSGGRNIALKQRAIQSSNQGNANDFSADKAVDGVTIDSLVTKTCSSTKHDGSDEEPYWTVHFEEPKIVNRYVLFNTIDDCCRDRLRGFTLTGYGVDSTAVFEYQDQKPEAQNIYTVTSVGINTPISSVVIKASTSNSDVETPILTLCEVEIYGDSVCPSGMYGLDCSEVCNYCRTAQDNACEVSTGVCVSGCKNIDVFGYCCTEECPTDYFGRDCKQRCSTNCRNGVCKDTIKRCENCITGKQGDYCQDDCNTGKYGDDCGLDCNLRCKDRMCDPINGDCLSGCRSGYTGEMCESICKHGKYGENCGKNCSEFCNTNGTVGEESPCHPVTGQCFYGCIQGYTNLTCDIAVQSSSPDSGPDVGVGVGVGLAVVVVVVVLIVVGIYCYRRSLVQRCVRKLSPDDNPDDQTRKEHTNHVQDHNLPADEEPSSQNPEHSNLDASSGHYVDMELYSRA